MGARKSNYKIKPEDILQKYKEFAGEVVKRDGKDGKDKIRTHPRPQPLNRYFIEYCKTEMGYFIKVEGVVEVSREKSKEQSLGRPIHKRTNRMRHSLHEFTVVEEHWVVTLMDFFYQEAIATDTVTRTETTEIPARGCVAQLTRTTRAH
jgi:hypothetical protein